MFHLFKKSLALLGTTTTLAGLGTGAALADIVHLDDVIIDGSLCVGLDCVSGEAFGFDTIRLKENNLRIRAFDTSSTASFPTNDWQLTFNDSSNGGLNKFSVDDIDGGRTPFTIEAGARSHALYVESDGDIGVGTNNPVVEMHLVRGDTPTVRLEQDGSSGFTPQTWDLAGNEANFFIRDVTNGSKLPIRIRPNTPTSAIHLFSTEVVLNDGSADLNTRIEGDSENNLFFVDASADMIGIGTNAPAARLHLAKADGADLRLENTTNAAIWDMKADNDNELEFNAVGSAGVEIRFTADGGFLTKTTSTAPASPTRGMLYNNQSGALCWYSGSAWIQVVGTGSC